MFRCQKCRKTQPEGTAPKRIVLATRPQTYVNKFKRDIRDREWEELVTHGWEIVKEMTVCSDPACSVKAIDTGALSGSLRANNA